MPTDGPQLDAIRQHPAYRRALWLVRLAVLPLAAFFYLAFSQHTEPGLALFGAWAILVLMILGALYLLARAGVPFARRGTSLSVVDRQVVSAIQRDLFGPRRP